MSATLEDAQLRRTGRRVEPPTVRDVAMDDHVVTRTIWQLTEYRLEHAGAFHDVHDFVGLGVPIEVRIELIRLGIQHRDVAVEEQRRAVERRRTTPLEAGGEEVPVTEGRLLIGGPHDVSQLARGLDGRGRMGVVKQRGRSDEALMPHQLFRIEPTVWTAEDGVPLPRHRTQRVIKRHPGRPRIRMCSVSLLQSGQGCWEAGVRNDEAAPDRRRFVDYSYCTAPAPSRGCQAARFRRAKNATAISPESISATVPGSGLTIVPTSP